MHPSDLIPEVERAKGEWSIIGEPFPALLPWISK